MNFPYTGEIYFQMYAQHDQSWHTQITPDQRMQNIQDTAQLLSMFADENSKEKVNNIAQRFEHSVFISATSLQGYIQSIQMKLSQLRSKAYGGDEQSLSNTITPLSAQTPQQPQSQVSQVPTPSQIAPTTPPQQQIPIHQPQMSHIPPPQDMYQPPPPLQQQPQQPQQQQFTRRQVDQSMLEIIKSKTQHFSALLEQAQRVLPFNKHILGDTNWLKFTTIAQMYHQHIIALQENQVVFLAEQIDQVKDHVEKLLNSVTTIEAENQNLNRMPPSDPSDPNWVDFIRSSALGQQTDLLQNEPIFEFPRNTILQLPLNDTGPDHMVNPYNLFQQSVNFAKHQSTTNKRKAHLTEKQDSPVAKKPRVATMEEIGQTCQNDELIQFLNLSWNMAWRGKETLLPNYIPKAMQCLKQNTMKPTKIIFYCGKPNPDEWWVENDNLFLRIIGIQCGTFTLI